MSAQISIIGGGIAGLTAALAFRRKGLEPLVFEAAPQFREIGAGIGLAANAIKAFEELGIAADVIERGRILPAFSVRDHKGRQITYTDSKIVSEKYGLDNFAIHRAGLHAYLLSQLDPVTLFSGKKAVDVTQDSGGVTIRFEDGSTQHTRYLVVADGIHSRLRKKLIPGSEPRYAGYTCWRAVIDDPGSGISEAFETWGRDGRFGLTPLKGQLYWYACLNAPQQSEKHRNFGVVDLQKQFAAYHDPIPEVLAATTDDKLIWSDICDLEPVKRFAFGNIVFIGDAAHATTPNLGQGACQAVEDALVLAQEWDRHASGKEAFRSFEKRRLARTHFVVNNSRRIGRIAQLENRLLIALRNAFFRSLPASAAERSFKKLYTVDF
ncbi:MAG: FAD-dependent monooxygenase [Bacteroidia bacterium]|nr:FAD-dependent monooxygenase [Bacteroidia bacterium]